MATPRSSLLPDVLGERRFCYLRRARFLWYVPGLPRAKATFCDNSSAQRRKEGAVTTSPETLRISYHKACGKSNLSGIRRGRPRLWQPAHPQKSGCEKVCCCSSKETW